MCVIKILKILSVFGSEKRSNGLSGVRRTDKRPGPAGSPSGVRVRRSPFLRSFHCIRARWTISMGCQGHKSDQLALPLSLSPCTHHLHNFHISSCSSAPAQKYLTDARCCDRRVSFRSAKLDEASVFSFQLYVIYVILLPAVCLCVCGCAPAVWHVLFLFRKFA